MRPALSAPAEEIAALLRQRGACFAPDIGLAVKRVGAEIEDALWELVAEGVATADGFASLRALIDRNGHGARRASPRRPRSWRAGAPLARRGRTRGALAPAGRWSLLEPLSDSEADNDGDVEAFARQLLARYGVVFRDLLARETLAPPWREVLVVLRRLEARGEIRGGRFVSGFVGEQYALPEAVEAMRAVRRRAGADAAPEYVRVAATDPLNLVGITSPGPRVPAVLGNAVLYRDGVPVASLEAGELVARRPLPAGERVDRNLRVYRLPVAAAAGVA